MIDINNRDNNREFIVAFLANFANHLPKEVLEANAHAMGTELADLDAELAKRIEDSPPNVITILDSIYSNATPTLSPELFQELVKACFSKYPAENFKKAVLEILAPEDQKDFIVLCEAPIRFKLQPFNEMIQVDIIKLARAIKEENFAKENKVLMLVALGIGVTTAVIIGAMIASSALLLLCLSTPLFIGLASIATVSSAYAVLKPIEKIIEASDVGGIEDVRKSILDRQLELNSTIKANEMNILCNPRAILDSWTEAKENDEGKVVATVNIPWKVKAVSLRVIVANYASQIGIGIAFGPSGFLVLAAAFSTLILAVTGVACLAIAMQKFQPEQEVVRSAEVLPSASNKPELKEESIGSVRVPLIGDFVITDVSVHSR